jgi:hypothetical protein
MVEYKNGMYDDNDYFRTEYDPPLVQARHLPLNCADLEPISVSVVTIDDDPPCQEEGASVISSESYSMMPEESVSEGKSERPNSLEAGIAGGVVGTLIGGPLLGVVAGGASAYYSTQGGAAGDVSRAIGEIGAASYSKAKELNRKHSLIDKSKRAAASAVKKAQDLNQKHHLLNRSKEAAGAAFDKAKKFDEKHTVVKKLAAFIMLCIKELVKIAEQVGGRLQEGETTKQLVASLGATAAETERAPQTVVSIY